MTLTPGSGARAEPTAITACQTISQPGSYRLANNLTGTGDCLVITTDGVTIDLAGFSISGAQTGITAAVGRPGERQGIAVRNGSISRVFIGVDLTGVSGSIVEGLRVFSHVGAGIIATGVVTRNTVSAGGQKTADGIIATGVVTWNNASNNATGIFAGPGSTLIGNTAIDNSLDGILASCPVNLTDNTAIGNGTARPGTANITLNGEGCHSEDNVAP
jgi:hypothetical protein